MSKVTKFYSFKIQRNHKEFLSSNSHLGVALPQENQFKTEAVFLQQCRAFRTRFFALQKELKQCCNP